MKSKQIEQNNNQNSKKINLIKKLGIWSFLFFLIKGLIWLGIFFGIGSVFV
jgi:hypothetical protein